MSRMRHPRLWLGALAVLGLAVYLLLPSDDRLPCQKEVTSFEKRYTQPQALKKALGNLEHGNYRLSGRQTYSTYMPSDLKGLLAIGEINALFIRSIGIAPSPGQAPLVIDYRVIENDRFDPNKKNQPKKPFSGYLLASFKQDAKEVYRIQIDYLDPRAADLERRIACAIRAFRRGSESVR